jgi:membrane protease YdiL (CAAX protease family)
MAEQDPGKEAPEHTPDASAPKKVATFLVFTFLLSSVFYYLITTSFAADHMEILIWSLMWCPGVSAIATRLLFQKNLNGCGFSWGETRWQILGILLPVALGFVMFAPVWLTGLGQFNGENAVQIFSVSYLPVCAVSIIISCFTALGEELGWRGLLVPEMSKCMTFTCVCLISGAIWAFWHYPLILFGPYHGAGPAWVSLLIFTPEVIAMGIVLAWLRQKSGSLLVTVFFHGFWNYFILAFYPALTTGNSATTLVLGEFGWAALVITIPLALIFWHFRGSLPGAEKTGA